MALTMEGKLSLSFYRGRPKTWSIFPTVSFIRSSRIIKLIQLPACAIGDWADWSECPTGCGQHVQERFRILNGEYSNWKELHLFAGLYESRACPLICVDVDENATELPDYY